MRRVALLLAICSVVLACRESGEPAPVLRAQGAFASDPAVTTLRSGKVELAIIGNTGEVWRSECGAGCKSSRQFGNFSRDIAPPPRGSVSAPALASWGDGRLDVFVVGGDGALWHDTWDNTYWLGWERLGGSLASAPAAATWGEGRLDVFAINGKGRMEHLYCAALGVPACRGSDWSTWEDLGAPPAGLQGDPSIVASPGERLDIVALGREGGVFHQGWERGWTGWRSLGGKFRYSPSVAQHGGSLDVFAVDDAGELWQATGTQKRFRPFKNARLTLGARPVAFGSAKGTMVLARHPEGSTLRSVHCDKAKCSFE